VSQETSNAFRWGGRHEGGTSNSVVRVPVHPDPRRQNANDIGEQLGFHPLVPKGKPLGLALIPVTHATLCISNTFNCYNYYRCYYPVKKLRATSFECLLVLYRFNNSFAEYLNNLGKGAATNLSELSTLIHFPKSRSSGDALRRALVSLTCSALDDKRVPGELAVAVVDKAMQSSKVHSERLP